MKWFRFTSAVIATLGLTSAAHAGLLDLFGSHGSSKSCGCAPCCQPQCCKPTIVKPCCPNVYTYQRKLSCLKPPCCDTCCAPRACCAPRNCAPACAPGCAAPANCAPACAPKSCAPACAPTCAAPANCAPACAPRNCAPACAPTCAAPANCAPACAPKSCCPQRGCCNNRCGKTRCCNANPCEIAKLIYKSQTACYAKDRRSAIHKLGDNYDCVCNPEIMTAFIYALNDADERVRWKAADEIGDQLRKNRCCCSQQVIAALTAALGDCDRGVRHQAVEALQACGYEVVDGCCNRGSGCVPGCVNGNMAPPPPAGGIKKAPPAPGTEKVYFPARLRYSRPVRSRNRLSNLFGLLN